MPAIVAQLGYKQRQIQRLDATLVRLKRMLKQLKKQRLVSRCLPKSAEFKDQISEIETEISSLWQRCIGAELDRIRLQQSIITLKRQLIEMVAKPNALGETAALR